VHTPGHELFNALRSEFRGELLRPDDDRYAEARSLWNAMTVRRPALIARCADPGDVQTAVRAAATGGVLTAIRCGGHSLAGFSSCDDGLVIDLSRLRQVQVDESGSRARASGGCLLGTIDVATQNAGLVFPAGVVSHTGASGLILGGGTGWLTRKFGLSCDNVLGFTLVTADGALVHTNERDNADLYWALRGGGGNFGVVVEFELQLHRLSSALLGCGFSRNEDMARVLRFWRDFMPEAPEELKWNLSLRLAPHSASVPAELRGHPTLSTSALWLGEEAAGQRYLKQIFSLGHPLGVTQDSISYLALQTMADGDFPHGRRYYTKSGYFQLLEDAAIEIMVDALGTIPSANSQIELAYLGGAAARVAAGETAFGDRSAPFIMNLLADWDQPAQDAENIGWVRDLFRKLRPSMTPGVYTNFMSGDEQERVEEAYRDRWDRLVAVKTQFDPQNFFRLNQNIPPRKAEPANENSRSLRVRPRR
jgi:FAD/FMN-containing dehydrogenase